LVLDCDHGTDISVFIELMVYFLS